MSARVLVLDDDNDVCSLYQAVLSDAGLEVDTTTDVNEAKRLVQNNEYQGVLTDIFLENDNGLEALKDLIQLSPCSQFFSFSSKASIPLAVEAVSKGAADFFPKTMGCQKIVEILKSRIAGSVDENSRIYKEIQSAKIIGQSKAMKTLSRRIYQFSKVDSTVLITGESGTGKELVGRALHQISHRKNEPFEAINCGAIPEPLLESELFGHKRGAFTDARSDKIGLFEYCSNGTLMLDEIGDMPLSLQVKLLRVLQEREIRPLGATRSIKVNPRIIACTHRDLMKMAAEGTFRQDLLFRLSVLKLPIAPLRERKNDIPALARTFVAQFNKKFSKSVAPPSMDLLVRLMNHDWPGNVRELQNSIERAVVLAKNNQLVYEDIFSEPHSQQEERNSTLSYIPLTHKVAKKNFEKTYIENLLKQAKGNISRASRLSGKHRVEIYRLMEKHNIHRSDYAERAQH